MAYDHKKSLRTLTDQQFSDGTTVDGARIDDALGESVEHFNSIPAGDVSTRFTKTQYVFGYQPAPYTGTPNGSTSPPRINVEDGTIEGTTFPWNFIKNSAETSARTDIGAAKPRPVYGDTVTPSDGFQNKWRIKGTNYHLEGSAAALAMSMNSKAWGDGAWKDDWQDLHDPSAPAGNPTAAVRKSPDTYQFAWSHSWIFTSPVILDSVCLLLRTDAPNHVYPTSGTTYGYYDAPFEFSALAGTPTWQTNCVSAHISVDSEFSKEERSLNAVEFIFQDRWLDGYDVNPYMKGSALHTYSDMLPNSPEYSGGTGWGVQGKIVRFRDMNIPIRRGARVRMNIVIPWVGTRSAALATQNQGLRTLNMVNRFPLFIGGTFPEGLEPMYGFSLNGSLNVLEPVGV